MYAKQTVRMPLSILFLHDLLQDVTVQREVRDQVLNLRNRMSKTHHATVKEMFEKEEKLTKKGPPFPWVAPDGRRIPSG
jgi:hypothetical protein